VILWPRGFIFKAWLPHSSALEATGESSLEPFPSIVASSAQQQLQHFFFLPGRSTTIVHLAGKAQNAQKVPINTD